MAASNGRVNLYLCCQGQGKSYQTETLVARDKNLLHLLCPSRRDIAHPMDYNVVYLDNR